MYWAGLFITAADVLIALGITSAAGRDDAPSRDPGRGRLGDDVRGRFPEPPFV
jgi:hypothetical protein